MKRTSAEKKKRKACLSHRIGGTVLVIVSIPLCMLIIAVFITKNFSLLLGVLLGLLGILWGTALRHGVFMEPELRRKRKGIYLSEEQFEKLENGIELPDLDVPVFLRHGEVAVYHCDASLITTENRLVELKGGYDGGSLRLTKNVSIQVGSNSARPVYGDVSTAHAGEFIITDQRIIFLHSQKGFELSHDDITAASYNKYTFVFQAENGAYELGMNRTDIAVTAFDGVRNGSLPIAE